MHVRRGEGGAGGVKPLALDLFCKAGGATKGLQRAGYHVLGLDIEPQPNYCGDAFRLGDALRPPLELSHFDLIWASPPCQAFTAHKRRPDHVQAAPNLIAPIRELLEESGVPWVIENVSGALPHMRSPFRLCGSMFGLDVQRHRYFETSFSVMAPACQHGLWPPRFPQATNRKNRRKTVEIGVWRIPLSVQQQAMGIDWMTLEELSNAIPPAYAEFIGRQAPKGDCR